MIFYEHMDRQRNMFAAIVMKIYMTKEGYQGGIKEGTNNLITYGYGLNPAEVTKRKKETGARKSAGYYILEKIEKYFFYLPVSMRLRV